MERNACFAGCSCRAKEPKSLACANARSKSDETRTVYRQVRKGRPVDRWHQSRRHLLRGVLGVLHQVGQSEGQAALVVPYIQAIVLAAVLVAAASLWFSL